MCLIKISHEDFPKVLADNKTSVVGSCGNDSVPSDNKSLFEPMMTIIYVAKWCQ